KSGQTCLISLIAGGRADAIMHDQIDFAILLDRGLGMQTIFVGRANKRSKKRVGLQGFRLVFGVKLATYEPGMRLARQLDDLHKLAVGRDTAEHQTFGFEPLAILRIELVAMAMTFA